MDGRAARERQTQRQRLERLIADADRQQRSILRQARTGDPDDPFTRGLRQTYNELDDEKTTSRNALAALKAAEEENAAEPG